MYIGPDRKRMEMHKRLLANISPELNKHVDNNTGEGIEGGICLPDEGEEMLTLFTEWAYTGDYALKDGILLANTGNQKEPKQDPWPSLHSHLQLCAFSEKFRLPTLKELAESKFHTEINRIEPNSERDATSLVMVIGYAYDNLPSLDPILMLLAQYAAWKLELLRGTSGFSDFILTKPGFLEELLMNLNGPKTRPIVPLKHLMNDSRIYYHSPTI